MKVIIHNRKYEDSVEICEDSLEEVRATAVYESVRRGWDIADMWGEVVEEEAQDD